MRTERDLSNVTYHYTIVKNRCRCRYESRIDALSQVLISRQKLASLDEKKNGEKKKSHLAVEGNPIIEKQGRLVVVMALSGCVTD